MTAVQVRDLSFTYRGTETAALSHIDLALQEGKSLAIMGEGGAGKSTLCRCLNGLIPRFQKGGFSGSVQVFGRDTRDHPVHEFARSVGMVFQDFESQLFSTRVELEVAFPLENFGMPRENMRGRIAEMLDLVGLSGFESRSPATLSGGEKQRVAIAAALASSPAVIVMDEPTSDLDPVGKSQVLSIARRLREEKAALVLVEHETEEALLADEVAVLSDGVLVRTGPTESVLADSEFLESYGIRPLQMAQLATCLGVEDPVLTVEDAGRVLEQRGRRVNAEAAQALRDADHERADSYGEPVIEVRGLVHRYAPGQEALAGVDLTIRKGEFVAVIGSNGSGKTTLAQHLNRLLEPSEGEVLVEGADTRRQTPRTLAGKVGYVFQNPDHQLFASTVAEEVAFGPRNFDIPEREIQQRTQTALAAVGMEDAADADPFTLTKGERQRVAVASMLAARPSVLIFDEPNTGLDYRQTRGMMDLIRSLNEAGHAIVIITHSMWVVAEYAHRAVVMQAGRIIADGPAREVFSDEQELAAASLSAPPITRLGRAMGFPFLSVEEAVSCLS